MITILAILLNSGEPSVASKEVIEEHIQQCGLSLTPVKDRWGGMYPDAAVSFQDGMPMIHLYKNTAGDDCIVTWLKANLSTYGIARSNPEP